MLQHGFRTDIQGVAMHKPDSPAYNRPGVFVVDDWRQRFVQLTGLNGAEASIRRRRYPDSPATSKDAPRGAGLLYFLAHFILKEHDTSMKLAVFLLGASIALAQQAKGPKLPGEDWVSLFNGTDLSGWRQVGREKWTVEDGVIHGQGITNAYGYLVTEKSYKDFHLFLRFLCVGPGNSGVYVHSHFKGDTVDILGWQIEIDRHIGRHTAGLYGDDRGWVAWPAPELETVIKPLDWNDMLIEVVGNRTRTHLNGVLMVDYTNPKPVYTDGAIALQLHAGGQGEMKFKDIWIRDLSAR
jgi:hypothetical protein